MSQEHELRKTLRDHYDAQEVPYEELEWQKASEQLNALRRKKRNRRAAILLTPLLLGLGMCVLGLYTFNRTEGPSIVATKHTLNLETAASLSPGATAAEVSSVTPGPSSQGQPNASAREPTLSNGARETEAHTVNVISASSPISVNTRKPEKRQQALPPNRNRSIRLNAPSLSLPFAPARQSIPPSEKTDPNDLVPQNAKTASLPDPKQTDNQQQDTPPALTLSEMGSTTAVPSEPAPQNVPNPLEKPNQQDSCVTNGTLTVASQAAKTTALPNDTLPELRFFANEGFFYEAGAAWLYGWKGSLKRDARGFSPLAGVNYMNALNRRYAFSFGVLYMQVPKLANSSKTSRISSYKYGEINQVTTITPAKLHYLVAPLQLHYYPDAEQVLGVGANLAYLLTVDATVKRYDESPGKNENHETTTLSGYTEGFSWFDTQLCAFYRRHLIKSLSLKAEVFVGLVDVKHNSFFRVTGRETNSGMKVSFVYDLFKKMKP